MNRKVKDLETAIWLCTYWAKRIFMSCGDCRAVWFYLFLGAQLQWDLDNLTGGQHVQD